MSTLVDYTEAFKKYRPESGALLAQGQGKHMLVLYKLKEPQMISKKSCRYMLEYRELSVKCEKSDDEAFACVWSDERTFYLRKEIKELLNEIKLGDANIFNHFNLF